MKAPPKRRPALQPRPDATGTAEAKAFVAEAPDAASRRWQRGSKTQVTLSISPELLAEVDLIADARGLSRSALLTVWLGEAIKAER